MVRTIMIATMHLVLVVSIFMWLVLIAYKVIFLPFLFFYILCILFIYFLYKNKKTTLYPPPPSLPTFTSYLGLHFMNTHKQEHVHEHTHTNEQLHKDTCSRTHTTNYHHHHKIWKATHHAHFVNEHTHTLGKSTHTYKSGIQHVHNRSRNWYTHVNLHVYNGDD